GFFADRAAAAHDGSAAWICVEPEALRRGARAYATSQCVLEGARTGAGATGVDRSMPQGAGGGRRNAARPHQRGRRTLVVCGYRRGGPGSSAESRDRRLAIVYHHLGIVAEERHDLAAAVGWCHKSLELKEALGDRPGMASTYHQ